MTYQDTSAQELCYYIAEHTIDVSDLYIIDSKKISKHGVDVELHVLGTSHSATVKKGNIVFTEVFACKEPKASQQCTTFTNPLHENIIIFETDAYRVTQEFKKMTFSQSIINRTIKNSRGISVVFPDKNGKPDKKSVTWVGARYVQHGVVIQSMHTYPDEDVIVFSESIILLQ